jgi:chaperonin GroES
MTRIRPKQGEALVEVLPNEISDGGIHIPDKYQYQERAQKAVVRRLGVWPVSKRGRLVAYEVKPGDTVYFPKTVGTWLHGEQHRLKVLPARRILAVVGREM